MNEAYFIAVLCSALFGGQPETAHSFTYPGGKVSIRMDCVTGNRVIEFGLDKRSNLDSLQQALFAAEVTGKAPVIALIDTDGKMGRFEWRIARAANAAGVPIWIIPAVLASGLGAGG
ncbi:hypothetical protein [Cribrihabitans neustonicus]|uniref:hypothetical protein n=1 Tax=Cribrihabitans neustonicus TaxID=1429085 RepID=UPI003B59E77B